MKQHRYQVLHRSCGQVEIVACWVSDAPYETEAEDAHIKQFAHEYHAYRGREDGQQPCPKAIMEANLDQYEIIKRRF